MNALEAEQVVVNVKTLLSGSVGWGIIDMQ